MGAFSKLQAYNFAILLARPFEDWDAYKLGIIDENGDIKKTPVTREEKNSLDTLENLIRKIKRILLKYLPSKKLISFLIAAYLLKNESNNDGYFTLEEIECIDKINEYLNDKEKDMLYNVLKSYNLI